MTDCFVLRYSNGDYVDLDGASGGYPYAVKEPRRAYIWTDKDAALKFASLEFGKTFTLWTIDWTVTKTYVSPGDKARASGDKEYAEFVRLSQKFGVVGELKCKFSVAWVGACKKPTAVGEEFCTEHLGTKCFKCNGQATRDCGHTAQFVCGTPMCDSHQHHSDG